MSSTSAVPAPAKRKYLANHNQQNPKRGGPGVLLTCETGREKKCRQEALDILNHYYRHPKAANKSDGKDDSTLSTDERTLSLDEEILQLQTKKVPQIYSVYETGVRGTITLLCTLPDAVLITPFTFAKETYQSPTLSDGKDNEEPQSKKAKIDGLTPSKHHPVLWDPVTTVRRVLDDLRRGDSGAPSSRFVTRMIPIQATCFTNEAEIQHVARELFRSKMVANEGCRALKSSSGTTPIDEKPVTTTFAIQVKRRICSHLKSQIVIEWIAKEAPKEWKVNLSDPKYTVVVEICKTLCCMSIIENLKEYGNFNLVVTRENAASSSLPNNDDGDASY